MIGVDIVDIKRFERFYDKYKEKALKRYLNDSEIELSKQKIETLAGFFASKEAISKALGCGIGKELTFLDIRIHKSPKNAPYFTLPKQIVEKYAVKDTSLSISHEKEYAIAIAYIECKSDFSKKLYH
ncbi:MAG: holo-ACP synthase [Epsilonproteobacteria bacterium]|nr:holo-ACP synthase [Campylobacterota bacterium]